MGRPSASSRARPLAAPSWSCARASTSPEDLAGTTLATPQLGNTQDVALRAWLAEQGYETTIEGGGDVTIAPTANADTLQLFQAGELDGAWLPEPWASRLVAEAGASVLVDERDLWPDGEFVTTHLIVRTEFLEEHPETVQALLRGHVAAVTALQDDPDEAPAIVNAAIEELTGEPLAEDVIVRAFDHLTITFDPIAASLSTSAEHAFAAGTLEEEVELQGIYSLDALNTILDEEGLPAVSDGGLGVDTSA